MRRMTTTRYAWFPGLDRLAIGLSGLCVVHCLASAVLLAMLSTVGGLLADPIFHEVGLTIAIGLGAIALGRGVMVHGYIMPVAMGSLGLGIMAGAITLPHDAGHAEAIWTVIGVGLLAMGHDLNRRAVA
jgi:MerC mercury resistance protein